jgi:hypothetical protein
MNAEKPLQATFPLNSITAVPFHLYDMDISMVLDLKRYTVVTNPMINNGTLKPISMYAPPHYNFVVMEMVKHFDVSKRNILSALETLGLSVLQNTYSLDTKKMSEIRTRLYKTNFPLAVDLFGHPENIFPYLNGKRRQNNVYVDPNTIAAPLGEISEFFCASISEVSAIACAHAILTWDDLPDSAKPVFDGDVALFNRHVRDVLSRAAPYLSS